MSSVPEIRIRVANQQPIQQSGEFVLYWMTAFRRTPWNFSLQRAAELARQLQQPLLVLEALRCDYRWAGDRFHQFFLDGMRDNQSACRQAGITYYPFVETKVGQGQGLLRELSASASVIVTDDYPCIFVPHMIAAAASQVACRLEAVDGNGILPLRLAEKTYLRAVDFRRFMHKNIRDQLAECPLPDPLSVLAGKDSTGPAKIPSKIAQQWPSTELGSADQAWLQTLPIDHTVFPVSTVGGNAAAVTEMHHFVAQRLAKYEDGRRDLDKVFTSGLSPYFRFGHLSVHQVVMQVLEQEGWSPDRMSEKSRGSNSGFWGTSSAAEAFLDELITWREIGFNMSSREENYQDYDSLPAWARATLQAHASDKRPTVYTLEQFERAETHDDLWNAAQRQLVSDGRIHNYMRMVWGKKILHWTADPRQALQIMIHLNNKYAIDGRDPNSYSGIFWVLGRFDRAWGPEREVFGKIRYMSEENTRKKLSVDNYLKRYAKAR